MDSKKTYSGINIESNDDQVWHGKQRQQPQRAMTLLHTVHHSKQYKPLKKDKMLTKTLDRASVGSSYEPLATYFR